MERGAPALSGVLETVVYCTTENEEATRRFYRDVVGLRAFGSTSGGHRVGAGVFLVFNREESSVQAAPPAHGATGRVHVWFLAAPGDYDRWKVLPADRSMKSSPT